MKRPEILAPAGSMETLISALRTGADAVYVGGEKFSARNNATNFSENELAEAVRLCHKYGAKIYLAVNTIIADDETHDFCRYIKSTSKMGIDGYIVQDSGALDIIRNAVPDAVLHASTQMSVHTAVGVRLLKEMGFVRAVPARELSADTLEKICREDIETEVFVHGALCMSVSGQCYMSAVMGSRSANRGCCGQACRLPFSACGISERNCLSLKDLSLIEQTAKLTEIGVDSLKIEGRMKRPEYVASAVNELKKALGGEIPDTDILMKIFSRSGFTDGYFTGKRSQMFGIREKENAISARQIFPKIHELYRSERAVHRVDFYAEIKSGKPVFLKAMCGDISAEVYGECPDTAKNSPVDTDTLGKQLSKLGDTVFYFGSLNADIDGGLFVPAGKLNELRRNVTEKLSELVTEKNTPKYTITDYTPQKSAVIRTETAEKLPVRTFCRTMEQARTAVEISDYVVLSPVLSISEPFLAEMSEYREKIILSAPRFIVDEEKITARLAEIKKLGFSHLLCHTLDSVAIGKNLGFRLHGNFTLNIFNSFSAEYMRKLGLEDCIFSVEATLGQYSQVRTELPLGALVYGRLPLMLTRNCPVRNEVGCKKCTGCIIDRTSRKFPVACSNDYVEILNPDILYMADRINEFSNIRFTAVLLHDENAEQTKSAVSGIKPCGNITRGLYYRGVNI
ncbi:MAG: U32 family peptidase [Ruminococcus flavefaciens]|nr:U32 family peptidase [Ruminococcus flavefaciens]MCM1229037.1 U32 family peptidase [Ruminococcus flavefaciens]